MTTVDMSQEESFMAGLLPNEKHIMPYRQTFQLKFFLLSSLGTLCQFIGIQQQGFKKIAASFHSTFPRHRYRSLNHCPWASSVNHNGVHRDREGFPFRNSAEKAAIRSLTFSFTPKKDSFSSFERLCSSQSHPIFGTAPYTPPRYSFRKFATVRTPLMSVRP